MSTSKPASHRRSNPVDIVKKALSYAESRLGQTINALSKDKEWLKKEVAEDTLRRVDRITSVCLSVRRMIETEHPSLRQGLTL